MLQGFGNPTTNSFNDPDLGAFAFLVPTDFANNPNLPGYAGCTSNLLPTTCAPFQDAVQGLLDNPRNTVDPQAKTLIFWINDGGTFNKGYHQDRRHRLPAAATTGIGAISARSTSASPAPTICTRWEQPIDGVCDQDMFHTTAARRAASTKCNGVRIAAALPLPRSRGLVQRTVVAHRLHERRRPTSSTRRTRRPTSTAISAPRTAVSTQYGNGGTYPCAIQDYTNIIPSYYTFDLSLGYNTMDAPANEYLRNIGVQLVVQNIIGSAGRPTATASAPAAATRVPAIS